MNKNELEEYNNIQKEEMLKHKYIESEKAGKDLGNDAIFDWIRKYGKTFHDWYFSNILKDKDKDKDKDNG